MKVLFLSDTHGQHRKLKNLPQADMLIYAGDVSQRGEDHEVEDFIKWFSKLEYQYKIFIAGNHDFYFEDETVNRIQRMLPPDACYLSVNHSISSFRTLAVIDWKIFVETLSIVEKTLLNDPAGIYGFYDSRSLSSSDRN